MKHVEIKVDGNILTIKIVYPEPRGQRVPPVGELVLWYGIFAPCGRLLGTTGFARGAPSKEFGPS